jgi:hypothetical protein
MHAEFAELLDHPVGSVALGDSGGNGQADRSDGTVWRHRCYFHDDTGGNYGKSPGGDVSFIIENFHGGSGAEAQDIHRVMGLGVVEHDLAWVNEWDMNPANHVENYRPGQREPQLFIAIGKTKVMMRVNSSDKSVGDADHKERSKGVVMGQATVDLPDPLEKPKAAPTASADDLLAQLAGDEIDRLLAESDSGKAPEAAPASDAMMKSSAAADIDALLSGESPSPAVVVAPPVVAEAAPAIEAVVEEPAETETGSNERAELAASELGQQSADLPDVDVDLPFFLKPFVWLSAPLDALPEQWRELVGKAAILTMVNAIAVLAYVVIFRRHH